MCVIIFNHFTLNRHTVIGSLVVFSSFLSVSDQTHIVLPVARILPCQHCADTCTRVLSKLAIFLTGGCRLSNAKCVVTLVFANTHE